MVKFVSPDDDDYDKVISHLKDLELENRGAENVKRTTATYVPFRPCDPST